MNWLKKIWLGFLANTLFKRAEFVLNKFEPLVVGVTGSVGKSTTKEAVYYVLKEKFPVSRNEGNFNNEIGVPLTIIQAKKPQGVVKWIELLWQSNFTLRKMKNYPAYLVLELAADQKGDIAKLCDMVKPMIGVITNVGEAHQEFFGSKRGIMIEKRSLIESLPKQGKAILNYDDELVMKMKTKSKAKVISYGLKPGADLSAKNIKIGLSGTSFKLVYNGSVIPIRLKLIGYSYVKAALAAAAVGLAVGMDIIDVVSGLSKWGSLPGRMNLIPGKNEIMIIDDSYNASPDSVVAAIATLKAMSLGKRQKVAILGSMWELGRATEAGHVRVGLKAAKFFDKLIVVQENRHLYEKGLKRGGMKKENIYSFATTDDLLAVIDDIVKPNNLVFVKGSQGKNRLERAVYRLMRDKQKATGLLVRQSQEWKKSVK